MLLKSDVQILSDAYVKMRLLIFKNINVPQNGACLAEAVIKDRPLSPIGFSETAFTSSFRYEAKAGAGDRIRTDDSHVGNVTLYH